MDNEHAVIGALLKMPAALNEVDLLPNDFDMESYRQTYQVIIDMFAENELIDVLTVADRMQRSCPMPNNHWIMFLGRAAKDCISAASISAYANLVLNASRIRQAKLIANDLINNIDSSDVPSDIVDSAVSKLMELSTDTRKTYEYSITQSLQGALELIEEARENKGTVGIPTGLKDLDKTLSGFHDSDLIVVAGRPAMGKTAVLLNFLDNSKQSVGLISSEQPHDQIGMRLLAINGSVNAHKMRNGTLCDNKNDPEYSKITVALNRLHKEGNIWINDKSGISIIEVIRQARKWKHQHKIKALYIDYIQRIKWTDQKLAKWEQVGNTVMALKELARELQIPIIALAQVNRNVESRTDRRPNMGDIANSGEIEKEADVILTLYRDEVYELESKKQGIMEINVLKNRHGPTGFVNVNWKSEHMQVKDFDYQNYGQ